MRRTCLLAAGCVFALSPPLFAEQDVSAILDCFIAARTRNVERGRRYTYVENADFFTYEKGGGLGKDRSATHEIVFLEGFRFRKLISGTPSRSIPARKRA
jgi:hypothetical protein